jgi:ABC-2 type transport system permease protein
MNRTISAIKKEILLLVRDPGGLALLFLMPVALVVVMTLIQDITFRKIDEKKLTLLLLDLDQDILGKYITEGLSESGYFIIDEKIDGDIPGEQELISAVAEGDYQIGIVINKGATGSVRENAEALMKRILEPDEIAKSTHNTGTISIYFDPIIRLSFKQTIVSNLENLVTQTESRILFETISENLKEILPGFGQIDIRQESSISLEQSYASESDRQIMPNSVQHNIPGWAIFAMFFIVVPLTGNIIREKSEGISFRLHMFPASRMVLLNAKLLVYLLVCLIQFIVMILIGVYVFPYLGLPSLEIGTHLAALFILTIFTAISAIAYGLAIGYVVRTHDQAATFGTVSVIILSAIGGLWVPTFVMPEVMQKISSLSPMNWSLEGYYAIFLRGGGLIEIWPSLVRIGIFSLFALVIAWLSSKLKTN